MKTKSLSLYSAIALAILGLQSCYPDDPWDILEGPPTPPTFDEKAVVWKSTEINYANCTNMFLYGDILLQGYSDIGLRFKLVAFDADKGNILYELSNFKYPIGANDGFKSAQKGQYLVFSHQKYLAAVDAANPKILWEAELAGGSDNILIIGDFVYRTEKIGGSSILQRFHLQTGQKESILHLTTNDHGQGRYEPELYLPARYLNSQNEECFVIVNNARNVKYDEYQFEVLAYNHVTKNILWIDKYELERGHNPVPIIKDDRVYLASRSTIYSYQASTGNLLWKFNNELPDLANFGNGHMMLLDNNTLISMSDGNKTIALHALDGTLRWVNNDASTTASNLSLQNDRFWFAKIGLCAMTIHGQTLITGYGAPHSAGAWNKPILSRSNNNHIYTYDGKWVYCLDAGKILN